MIRKSIFIEHSFTEVTTKYQLIKTIGEGNYGKVYRVLNKETLEYCACKEIKKSKIQTQERFRIEIDLLKSLDHQNIVKLYEIFEDDLNIYLILEECKGGELFESLKSCVNKKKFYTERDAAILFKQIMSAITYCHNRGVCHRDLKPENLIFHNQTDNLLKVIDFGLSKYFLKTNNNTMNSVVGTIFYMAPEVFMGDYNEKCDVWSAGVILYILLCGKAPFMGKSANQIKKKIIDLEYNFNSLKWKTISNEAKDLIKKIFVNSEIRLTSNDVLNHDWVKEYAPNSTEQISELEIDKIIEFSFLNILQKSIISFISYRYNLGQINSLNEIFKSFDLNSDGEISISELKQGINLLGIKQIINLDDEEIEYIFNECDLDKNGLINYHEFISSTIDYKNCIKPEHVFEAFRSFDKDKNGKINLKELSDVIKPKCDEDLDNIKNLMQEIDLNGDGEIDINEFFGNLGINFSK